jgi:hypothetical protein
VPLTCRQGADNTELGAIPGTRSALPDATYRVEVTTQDVAAAGLDNSDGTSGTSTLTVRQGTDEVRCRPIKHPGTDCGHCTDDGPLDVGNLKGTGTTVYFVPNSQRLAQLTGCKLPASGEPGYCASAAPTRARWAASASLIHRCWSSSKTAFGYLVVVHAPGSMLAIALRTAGSCRA